MLRLVSWPADARILYCVVNMCWCIKTEIQLLAVEKASSCNLFKVTNDRLFKILCDNRTEMSKLCVNRNVQASFLSPPPSPSSKSPSHCRLRRHIIANLTSNIRSPKCIDGSNKYSCRSAAGECGVMMYRSAQQRGALCSRWVMATTSAVKTDARRWTGTIRK